MANIIPQKESELDVKYDKKRTWRAPGGYETRGGGGPGVMIPLVGKGKGDILTCMKTMNPRDSGVETSA
jgi:hypothetical protein